jgi:hypothetical protein
MFLDDFQTMQASKRNAGVPSAMVARQSLNDEELVGCKTITILIKICENIYIYKIEAF